MKTRYIVTTVTKQQSLFDDERSDHRTRVMAALKGYHRGRKQGRTYKGAGRTIAGPTLFNGAALGVAGGRLDGPLSLAEDARGRGTIGGCALVNDASQDVKDNVCRKSLCHKGIGVFETYG